MKMLVYTGHQEEISLSFNDQSLVFKQGVARPAPQGLIDQVTGKVTGHAASDDFKLVDDAAARGAQAQPKGKD